MEVTTHPGTPRSLSSVTPEGRTGSTLNDTHREKVNTSPLGFWTIPHGSERRLVNLLHYFFDCGLDKLSVGLEDVVEQWEYLGLWEYRVPHGHSWVRCPCSPSSLNHYRKHYHHHRHQQ